MAAEKKVWLRLTVSRAGPSVVYTRGQIVQWPEREAARLVAAGQAVYATQAEIKSLETA